MTIQFSQNLKWLKIKSQSKVEKKSSISRIKSVKRYSKKQHKQQIMVVLFHLYMMKRMTEKFLKRLNKPSINASEKSELQKKLRKTKKNSLPNGRI